MEWSRERYKRNARGILKKNYWFIIAVCFIISFLRIEHTSSTSLIHMYNSTEETIQGSEMISNWDIWIGDRDKDGNLIPSQQQSRWSGLEKNIFNSVTENNSYLFKLLQAGKNFFNAHEILVMSLLILAAALQFGYFALIQNSLLVGQKRFLLENCAEKKPEISKLCYTFRRGAFWNSVKVMFLRYIFQGLWWLTIIGGVIKSYEYRMIPFILAENPELPYHEVFSLSKAMMQGRKWNLFVMDLSFLGWTILEGFTFGLTGIFYSYPYMAAAEAEVYMDLRMDAIQNQRMYYEGLNEPLFSKS